MLRAKPRAFASRTRGIEGVATRMIGRDAELEALQAAFKRLFVERKLAAVTVVAEAGIGKSRLLYEFEAWSETRPERFFLFRGRATPQTGTASPTACCATSSPGASRSPTTTASRRRGRKIEEGIVPLFVDDDGPDLAEGHAHLLGHLIGIEWKRQPPRHAASSTTPSRSATAPSTPRRSCSAGVGAHRRQPGRPAARRPALGRQREPGLSRTTWPRSTATCRCWCWPCTRPTLFERRADWRSTEGVHQRIDLQPLGQDRQPACSSNELLKKLPEVPAALRELLTGGAEGNPFYMEELVQDADRPGRDRDRRAPGR